MLHIAFGEWFAIIGGSYLEICTITSRKKEQLSKTKATQIKNFSAGGKLMSL